MKRTAGLVISLILLTSVMVVQARALSLAGSGGIAAAGPNVFAVWLERNPGANAICFRRSTNSGATWSPLKRLVVSLGLSSPVIAVSQPNVYITYQQYNNVAYPIYLLKSPDRGKTWNSPVLLSGASSYGMNPAISASSSRVNVYWDEGYGSTVILGHNRSEDNGKTWAGPEYFPFGDTTGRRSGASAASEGPVDWVSWTESTTGWGCFRGVGAMYSMIVVIGYPQRFGLSIDCSKDLIGMIWTELGVGASPVHFSRSDETWSGWMDSVSLNSAAYCSEPRLAHSGASAYAAWMGNVPPESFSGVYFARSTDSGLTWKPDKAISPAGHSCQGVRLAASGSGVYVTWWEMVKTDAGSRQDLYLRRSTDKGLSWKAAKKIGSFLAPFI